MDAILTKTEERPIGFRNLWGEWVTENGIEFRIFGNDTISFITFHKTYKWGKSIREIKHFINHINDGAFYFQMEKSIHELLYHPKTDSIEIKKVTSCIRKKV